MNPRLESIFTRRSVRSYSRQDVGDDLVRDLLEAAMAAPSAVARDPWRFVVIRDHSVLVSIAEGLPNGKMLPDASVGIAVCGELAAAHRSQLSYLLQDCSAATENILLAASALGLGACWLGVHPREDRIRHVSRVLDLPEGILPVAVIAIGWPAEAPPARTRYSEAYVHHDRW
jgi:nitroreductase